MEFAKPGHTVKFRGLIGAAHLNGTEGTLIRFIASEQRWCVRCDGDNNEVVKAKPENLIRKPPTIDPSFTGAKSTWGGSGGVGSGHVDLSVANDPNSWATGLSREDQYEWFSNCYQMRCEDDYVCGGCYLHGTYLPQATPESISKDFLIFCILAHRAKCVPADWNWGDFLKAAIDYIPYAFDKSDAKERWGSENYFQGASGCGRSLRYTAGHIYKSGVDEAGNSAQHVEVAKAAHENEIELQELVGGRDAWVTLTQNLARSVRFSGQYGYTGEFGITR
jgi:hypothetical protein